MADNQMTYYSVETQDFYVRRQVILKNNKGKPRIMVNVDNDGNLIHHSINFVQNTDPTFQVRIPGLMEFRSNRQTNEERTDDLLKHIMTGYRPQIPSHVFVRTFDRTLDYLSTIWSADPVERKRLIPDEYYTEEVTRFYDTEQYRNAIHAVYPCYRQLPGQPLELVLGVAYMPIPELQQRTYSYEIGPEQNDLAFDITESFIDITNRGQYNYGNGQLMPRADDAESQCTALYVCRGARLVVTDNRQTQNERFCNSLYQMGSLVVVRGEIQAVINCEEWREEITSNYRVRKQYLGVMLENYFHPGEKVTGPFSAVEINMETGGKTQNLNLRSSWRRVLFLGGADSKHNSASWRLHIHSDPDNDQVNNATLYLLEGGYLLDASAWIPGFTQIYWRHRYERFFETVLEPTTDNVLPFIVPDDAFFFKRILGIEESVIALTVQWPYAGEPGGELHCMPDSYRTDGHDGDDRDVRRYIPYEWKAHEDLWLRNIERPFNKPYWLELTETAPAAPPLYPPYLTREAIHTQQKMCYLDRNDRVYAHDSVQDNYGNTIIRYRINDKEDLYTLDVTHELAEAWLPYTEELKELMPIHFDQSQTSQWIRLGNDFRYYMKADWDRFPADTMRAHYVSYYLKPGALNIDSEWHLEDMDVDESNEAGVGQNNDANNMVEAEEGNQEADQAGYGQDMIVE